MNPAATENRRIVIRKQMGASMLEEQTKVEVLVSRPLTSTHKPRRYPRIAVLGLRESMAWVVRELRVLDTLVRLVGMELVIVVKWVVMELVIVVKWVVKLVGMELVTTVVGLVVNSGSSVLLLETSVLLVNRDSSVLLLESSVLLVNRGPSVLLLKPSLVLMNSSLTFFAGQIKSSQTSASSG